MPRRKGSDVVRNRQCLTEEEARGEGEANVEQQEPQVQDLNPDPSSYFGMNLAAALAAERQMRGSEETGGSERATPWRVSLMKLLEETEGNVCAAKKMRGEGIRVLK
ncbi:unnamed protein product [Vicia faba]|uniref:Uncharacterized protein n=1 Tax=Vicia faba TaxID=3906 RepID=A0AAV1AQH1_VICFA|nr:unnamed protein product [Vicia faba]